MDFVLEDAHNNVVGIEVKATATPRNDDVAGLRHLQDALGTRCIRCVLLCLCRDVVPFAARLHALPLSMLWWMGAAPL